MQTRKTPTHKTIPRSNANTLAHSRAIFIIGVVFLVCMLPFVAAAPETNLVSAWLMEEGSGATTADSVGSNDLNLAGGYVWTTDSPVCGNEQIEFDGTGTARDLSTTDMTNAEFSFNIWYRSPSTADAYYGLAGEPRVTSNYAWLVNTATPGGYAQFALYDGTSNPGIASSTDVMDTTWHMITATVDATNLTIYVDGVREASTPNTATPSIQNSFTIGAHPATLAQKVVGNISHAMYWDRALTHAEISGIYQNESTGDCYPWQAVTTPSPTYNSTNYTLEFIGSSTSGAGAAYAYLNTTCLETVENSTCLVNLQGTINGVNHSFIADPVLVEHDLTFFVDANESFYSQVGVVSTNPSSGTFGYYALNNNESASINYTLTGAVTNVSIIPDIFDGFTIDFNTTAVCPLSSGNADRTFFMFAIGVAVVLFIFAFTLDNAYIGTLASLLLVYIGMISFPCDTYIALLFCFMGAGGIYLSLTQLSLTQT